MCEVLIPVAPEVGLCGKALEKSLGFKDRRDLAR